MSRNAAGASAPGNTEGNGGIWVLVFGLAVCVLASGMDFHPFWRGPPPLGPGPALVSMFGVSRKRLPAHWLYVLAIYQTYWCNATENIALHNGRATPPARHEQAQAARLFQGAA